MKVLIKLGGTLLDSAETRNRLAQEIGQAASSGVEITVVHGGGKQMTRFLAERGVESRFVNGLRVTSDQVLDAVLKVFAGSVNHELVAAFAAQGIRAVGLTGMDGYVALAEQLSPELGHVGRVISSDPALLNLLASNGYLAVVACVAGNGDGQYFNVNADQMAVACAVSFCAAKLIFLTDVEGVLDSFGQICPNLSIADCEDLIERGIAAGGMRAKLDAAISALRQHVPEVVIAPGATNGIVDTLLRGESAGTVIRGGNA